MRQIIVNVEKPELVVVTGMEAKPCRTECSTAEEVFIRDHRFIVHLYARDEESLETQRYLGALTCWYVNADSAKDISGVAEHCCRLGIIMADVTEAGFALDNLAVVTGAEFVKDAAYADLELIFGKLYCIMCSAMCRVFNNNQCCRMPAIYFDFTQIDDQSASLMRRFISEYKDGDVRRKDIRDGEVLYVHKIPWHPKDVEDEAAGTPQVWR